MRCDARAPDDRTVYRPIESTTTTTTRASPCARRSDASESVRATVRRTRPSLTRDVDARCDDARDGDDDARADERDGDDDDECDECDDDDSSRARVHRRRRARRCTG